MSAVFDRILRMLEENLILISVFILTMIIFKMIEADPALTTNEGFMYLATGIIITGLVNGIIQKQNTQQQRSNERVTETLATAAAAPRSPTVPASVEEVKIDAEKATIHEQPQPTSDRPAPASSRPAWVEAD